ncbi:DUF2189 domain-containing protein [Albidovulum sp.]|uniref:DUF2189 domain-containing protein n=1 Tax=Albidovulum sp. TaxID=1872424 RepID=UPI0039B8268A
MTTTIGNPLSWGMKVLGAAGRDIGRVAHDLGGEAMPRPRVRRIGLSDIRAALKAGVADLAAFRSDVIAAAVIYPVAGACLIWIALHRDLLHLVFPLLAGFALLGPAAAVGLYEMSRRREAGQAVSWGDGLGVIASPRIGAILALALGHLAVFVLWLLAAHWVFLATMGPTAPDSTAQFLRDMLTTPAGWAMIAIGLPLGFLFAALVLVTSAVSFPLLLDRPVGLPVAVVTSVRVARESPAAIALWGLVVAAALVLGALPFLIGLAVVMPVLGHATWHLYRRAVG